MLDSTSHLLVVLGRLHRAALARRLGEVGLHVGAELALAEVWRAEGITHSELADRLGVSRAAVTKLVRGLERFGLLERIGDPDDGRVSRLHSTHEGRRLRRQVERAWREAEDEMLASLTPGDIATLHELLARAVRS